MSKVTLTFESEFRVSVFNDSDGTKVVGLRYSNLDTVKEPVNSFHERRIGDKGTVRLCSSILAVHDNDMFAVAVNTEDGLSLEEEVECHDTPVN